MSMPDLSRVSLTDMVGIAFRLFMRRNEVIRWAREGQELLAFILGSAGSQVQRTYDVKWIQQSLNYSMGTRLAVDGELGQRTEDEIKNFQRKHGLFPDGWVGLLTGAKMEEENAKPRR